jgi:hypothetical protein
MAQRFYPNELYMARECPNCGAKLNLGKLLRAIKATALQKEQSRINGKKGGRPPLKKLTNKL